MVVCYCAYVCVCVCWHACLHVCNQYVCMCCEIRCYWAPLTGVSLRCLVSLLEIKQHTAHTHACTDTNTDTSPCGDYQIPSDPLEASNWSGIHFAFYLVAMEGLTTGVWRDLIHTLLHMYTLHDSHSTKRYILTYSHIEYYDWNFLKNEWTIDGFR